MLGEFTLDADTRKLKFRGLIDGFPLFEGYIKVDGFTRTIFQIPPLPGVSPADGLLGPANRAVEVDLSNL